jgi:hypothetical protein
MNTLLLQVNSQPVLNLLYEMQALDLVKVLNDTPSNPQRPDSSGRVFPEEAVEQCSSPEQPDDEWDIKQVLKRADKEKVAAIKEIFAPYQVSMKGYKFNRDEANDYD